MPEHPCCRSSSTLVIGIDEVGRGSLIGDVVTAAVVFTGTIPDGLKDSKKLSEKKRVHFNELIRSRGIVSIGRATVDEIDEIGILAATLVAMKRAWEGIEADIRRQALVIVDGEQAPAINAPMELMPRADDLCPTVSAASIIAKVSRDDDIKLLHVSDGRYGWDRNKGYGTKEHVGAITKFGPSEYHRRSFAPVRGMFKKGISCNGDAR